MKVLIGEKVNSCERGIVVAVNDSPTRHPEESNRAYENNPVCVEKRELNK